MTPKDNFSLLTITNLIEILGNNYEINYFMIDILKFNHSKFDLIIDTIRIPLLRLTR